MAIGHPVDFWFWSDVGVSPVSCGRAVRATWFTSFSKGHDPLHFTEKRAGSQLEGQKHTPSTHYLRCIIVKCQSKYGLMLFLCLARNPKLHICVTSLKSSFLRTPDRQSQSWTDIHSCCSDVSFFQSFAAKNISPTFDFIVANNGL